MSGDALNRRQARDLEDRERHLRDDLRNIDDQLVGLGVMLAVVALPFAFWLVPAQVFYVVGGAAAAVALLAIARRRHHLAHVTCAVAYAGAGGVTSAAILGAVADGSIEWPLAGPVTSGVVRALFAIGVVLLVQHLPDGPPARKGVRP